MLSKNIKTIFTNTGFLRFSFFIVILVFQGTFFNESEAQEKLQLTTETGVAFEAIATGPEESKAGILLVHDWFGVSEFYQEAAARLGALGYRVIAVDLYNGQSAETHKDAFALMQAMIPENADGKVNAGLKALKKEGRKIATFGFSLGTEYAFRGAISEAVDAVVIWYGFSPDNASQLEGFRANALFVYGSLDGPAADQAATTSKLMDAQGLKAEIYIYPQAHHAFAQPLFNAGKTYDPIAAEAAWVVTEDFLDRKLK